MKPLLLVFISGVIFALGLGISGMTDANKVIAFLNVGGQWDPSLGFVMVGAIGVHVVFQRLMMKRGSPVYGTEFERPPTHKLQKRLVGGSAIFGVGWGISGFCPGPAFVSTVQFGAGAVGFSVAMMVGMFVYNIVHRLISQRSS